MPNSKKHVTISAGEMAVVIVNQLEDAFDRHGEEQALRVLEELRLNAQESFNSESIDGELIKRLAIEF